MLLLMGWTIRARAYKRVCERDDLLHEHGNAYLGKRHFKRDHEPDRFNRGIGEQCNRGPLDDGGSN